MELRGSVGKRNKVAEIMLAEARVLGFRDNTLTLGHTTGALAERINAPANNSVIVDVLREEFQRDIEVNCVVGTDPKTAGFDAPRAPQAKPEWNPNAPEREPSDDKEAESKPGWRSRIAKATEVAKQRDDEFARTPQFSNGCRCRPSRRAPRTSRRRKNRRPIRAMTKNATWSKPRSPQAKWTTAAPPR